MITRMAPTPSGFLHQGNIFNFLLNWLWARSKGGKVLLRIDDADAERKRPEYVEDVFRVLEWLGLDWDIGPAGPDDFEKNWSQHRRSGLYEAMLNHLKEKNLLFACTCSRKQMNENGCLCRQKQIPLSAAGAAWKIQPPADTMVSIHDKTMGNVTAELTNAFVVRKKDGIAAYQLASVADDRHFCVTHICRGEDLLASTAMQLYLDKLAGSPWLQQCSFRHHPLLTDDDGIKLSKSAGRHSQSISTSMKKEELIFLFARWMGWKEPFPDSPAEMLERIPEFF